MSMTPDSFDDEADAFRNINTLEELGKA